MGLEDFEKELAQGKSQESREHRQRDRDEERKHHRHHHRSHHDKERDDERRHKRHRDRTDDDDRRERRHKRHRSGSPRRDRRERDDGRGHRSRETQSDNPVKVFDKGDEDDGDEWVEKESVVAPPQENLLDQRDQDLKSTQVPQRDAWMQEPGALDVDYVQRKPKSPPRGQFVSAKDTHDFKVQESDINRHLADLQNDFDSEGEGEGEGKGTDDKIKDVPAQHEVTYTFGDSGSSWRMTKLQAVYRQAKESGKSIDDVALERFGDMREFDDAREEERELDRRKMYGKDYVGLEKPSGEFYQERKMAAEKLRGAQDAAAATENASRPQSEVLAEVLPATTTTPLDVSALNKLKAQVMKAKLRNAPNAAELEKEFNLAQKLANSSQSDVVVLSTMENRMLAGDRSGEVIAISGKRGRERGLVKENEDMSIEDMVKHEKRTRGANGGEGRAFAERIAKDGKFKNDLDYMDDNATDLSKKVVKSDTNLRNAAVGDFQKMQRVLENCPLCYHEESGQPPVAPVVSLATRTYMTLATEPEIAKGGVVIAPIQHRLNLLECDDDEWEEIRNFMKSLTRFYHAQDKSVIFYENAAFMSSRKGHAALNAIPLPHHLAENAPAYFKEAVLASDEQWSQHKPIIDTLALVQRAGYGKAAFRKAMVKEMPYFHVFYSLDGGMGHVIEDERRWPKGDLFAREIIGGMLDKGPEVIKRQGRWEKHDRRVEGFRKKWEKFDWTAVLMEPQ
ncbi:related to cell cycle control protein (Cwf19) [Ramularia collo-cygni]|uniref:Related to cell cycle control protein (Cwf19) n=1 Tax=Ramularia collo-cygni TaxID=112498 RepID=A0A2D3UML1_9PEZI|nr:related to cell cycle control protein (Cwf19) [Ramularia collo-cygni]CZT16642.1 related to cell cycle control protein (Cwf19) [Ramularia collo-cygni]